MQVSFWWTNFRMRLQYQTSFYTSVASQPVIQSQSLCDIDVQQLPYGGALPLPYGVAVYCQRFEISRIGKLGSKYDLLNAFLAISTPLIEFFNGHFSPVWALTTYSECLNDTLANDSTKEVHPDFFISRDFRALSGDLYSLRPQKR